MRRQLHPLVLCAPFAHRTFEKPLGYAGDYEMVNMIVRDLYEGNSLFAKILNTWFLRQMPAEAHRNRIKYLRDRLIQETARAARAGRPARILNLGCGPAFEIQRFLEESPISDNAHFTLLDFNDETLQYTQAKLAAAARDNRRRTEVRLQKKSVLQVLKEYARPKVEPPKYDMVYCAGLFDYLADPACKHLMNIFYDMTVPGGLVLATNVEPSNPMRNGMEHLLDWNLIYRNGAQFRTLHPQKAEAENVEVYGDVTGVNVILEVRKTA
jgi:extracellular factor (EF) 3-hydroxypalmitic acid methyl ester biosynthesis protein